jgi:hypothetical protein
MRIVSPNECGEKLRFKTKKCENHECIEDRPHSGEKHRCLCGITWTTDPTLAGNNWSAEQVIWENHLTQLPHNDKRNHKKKRDNN